MSSINVAGYNEAMAVRYAYLSGAVLITYEFIIQFGNEVELFWAFLTIGEAVAMGTVFGIPNEKMIGTNEPFEGVFTCADADPSDGSHWVVYYWVSTLVIETILLGLAVRKAWENRSETGSGLMRQLTRESVLYFVTIFWIYAANLAMWVVNRASMDSVSGIYRLTEGVDYDKRAANSIWIRGAEHICEPTPDSSATDAPPKRHNFRGREATTDNI
ncbi:hypothetical protein AMATHDRAFT_6039 [Amanita thiersii Skay4041]|uniref:Uncharacterized protein n=1 Tax=Amanita thiersii Skay4041 TaxID=703135 RepID=A0A2A9NDP7_9AGAR|nr:hypothetical protein AMATHDRAFT_6039 [Amanita thiersii Skay4041]